MRLNVHVGHGKTGSSFLQSWWAINADVLRSRHGIDDPLRAPRSGRHEEDGVRGRFSMGNGFILEEVLADSDPVAVLAELAAGLPDHGQLLFSCERFVRSLPQHLARLESSALAAGSSSTAAFQPPAPWPTARPQRSRNIAAARWRS